MSQVLEAIWSFFFSKHLLSFKAFFRFPEQGFDPCAEGAKLEDRFYNNRSFKVRHIGNKIGLALSNSFLDVLFS